MILFGPENYIFEVRMRTNWPLIYWDRLRVFFYRKRHIFYLRKIFEKIVA